MTRNTPSISRRTALRTVAGASLGCFAGCLQGDWTGSNGSNGPLQQVGVEGTELVVELAPAASISQVTLVQANGELFDQQAVPNGTEQVSFELDTTYSPGDYRVVAQRQEEAINEKTVTVRPALQIEDIDLYRNVPEKPWNEIYGDTETDRLKNGEAFVTVKNSGSGPEAAAGLTFSGDVPNPVNDPRGSGMYDVETVIVKPGEKTDLFSDSFPFGPRSESGMGCSPDGNNGEFTVAVKTRAGPTPVTKTFAVQYSGSEQMHDCEVSITEI